MIFKFFRVRRCLKYVRIFVVLLCSIVCVYVIIKAIKKVPTVNNIIDKLRELRNIYDCQVQEHIYTYVMFVCKVRLRVYLRLM